MPDARIALLTDRGVLRLTGPDARKLLQGIVTADLDRLPQEGAAHTGLLSAQGKILFDFFVATDGDGLLVETPRASVAGLKQRLEMYRLRADATISDVTSDYTVAACWGGPHQATHEDSPTLGFRDPRHPFLGFRHLASLASEWKRDREGAAPASQEDYHAHRIGLGVPDAGRDFVLGEAFPHEALYDQTHSVSFTKGCYVGQEVVSRMEHRSTARKRIVPVEASSRAPLPASGTDVMAGEVTIGTLGSTAGHRGLALLRIDRAAEFGAKGVALTAAGTPVEIRLPEWVNFQLNTGSTADPS